MGHQTAARSSSSLRSHPDVALCCQCARTVSSLHFSLVGWWFCLSVCLSPVCCCPTTDWGFLLALFCLKALRGFLLLFHTVTAVFLLLFRSLCRVALLLLGESRFAASLLGWSFAVFSIPPFFFSAIVFIWNNTPPPPPPRLLYFQGPRVVYRGRERKRTKETQSRGRRIHLNLQSVNSVYGFHSDVSAELLAAPSLIRSRFVSG